MKKINNTKTITVGEREFELAYRYTKKETEINYHIEHGFESEIMEGVVEHKGYTVKFKKDQVSKVGHGLSSQIKNALEKIGKAHYIMVHVGTKPVVVPLTEEQFNSIHKTFENLKNEAMAEVEVETEETTEKVKEENTVETATAEARETGRKVILSRIAVNGTGESDTDIITEYVDKDGKVSKNREPMH